MTIIVGGIGTIINDKNWSIGDGLWALRWWMELTLNVVTIKNIFLLKSKTENNFFYKDRLKCFFLIFQNETKHGSVFGSKSNSRGRKGVLILPRGRVTSAASHSGLGKRGRTWWPRGGQGSNSGRPQSIHLVAVGEARSITSGGKERIQFKRKCDTENWERRQHQIREGEEEDGARARPKPSKSRSSGHPISEIEAPLPVIRFI